MKEAQGSVATPNVPAINSGLDSPGYLRAPTVDDQMLDDNHVVNMALVDLANKARMAGHTVPLSRQAWGEMVDEWIAEFHAATTDAKKADAEQAARARR